MTRTQLIEGVILVALLVVFFLFISVSLNWIGVPQSVLFGRNLIHAELFDRIMIR